MSIYDRRFVLFSGKGGVGKTTVASAFALSCARRGQKTLLIELNVKDKFSSYFGSRAVSTDIVEIEENLYGVNITPKAALEEYGLMVLKVKLIYKAVFENRIIHSFLRSVPGLNDLLMLGKAHYHATERQTDGSYVWDKVVIDAPATGHGIFFLQIPSVITSILSSGRMYEEARGIEEFLQDVDKTALVLVTLPEEMPVNETLMLRDTMRDKLSIEAHAIVANAVYEPLFEDDQVEWLVEAADATEPDEMVGGFVEAGAFRHQRVALQRKYLRQLVESVNLPLYQLPYHFVDRVTFPVVSALAEDLGAQIEGDGSEHQEATGTRRG